MVYFQEDAWMRRPQRHCRVRAKGRQIFIAQLNRRRHFIHFAHNASQTLELFNGWIDALELMHWMCNFNGFRPDKNGIGCIPLLKWCQYLVKKCNFYGRASASYAVFNEYCCWPSALNPRFIARCMQSYSKDLAIVCKSGVFGDAVR